MGHSTGLELDGIVTSTSMHIHHPQKRKVWVKYYIGGHRTLTDVLPTSQNVRCRALTSHGEASGWVSHAEGGNVSQAPVAYI